MVGLSGIGYGLARLAAPQRLPCVLAMAPPEPRPAEDPKCDAAGPVAGISTHLQKGENE